MSRFRWLSCQEAAEIYFSILGILLTGGDEGDSSQVTSELYVPGPCPIINCRLPNLIKERNGHTQDGFLACGGYFSGLDCESLDPGSGWGLSHEWPELPSRVQHVSWSSPAGVFLIGGFDNGTLGPPEITSPETTMKLQLTGGVLGFELKKRTS